MSSVFPCWAAGPAYVWVTLCCKGNGSGRLLRASSSSINRFLSPLASRPVNASVRPVRFAPRTAELARTACCNRSLRRKETLSQFGLLPRPEQAPPRCHAHQQSRRLPITGTRTASTTCGMSETLPMRESVAERRNEPRWPPPSNPEATIKSSPACSRATASSGVVAVPIVLIPCLRHSVNISAGGIPKVKLSTGARASMTAATCAPKSRDLAST